MPQPNKKNHNNQKKRAKEEKDIADLMEENLELNRQMYEMLKSVKNYILMQRIFFVLKVLIILIPLILGFVYLPPLVKSWAQEYGGIFQFDLEKNKTQENTDIQQLEESINNLDREEKEELLKRISR
jgi:hypothetical protein